MPTLRQNPPGRIRGERYFKQQASPCPKATVAVMGVAVGAVLTYLSLYIDLGGIQIYGNTSANWLSRSPKAASRLPGAYLYSSDDISPSLENSSGIVEKKRSLTTTPTDLSDDISERNTNCRERRHFAFVKVHKAGSTTPYSIFQRFGYKRHLQFVLPSNERVDVGWPYLMKQEDYIQPIPGRPFDLLVDHTVYNREIFRNLMPNDTVYLAVVREPYSHLKSVLNWYGVVRKYRLNKEHPVSALLKHAEELDRTWLVQRKHRQPFSWTRNFMSYDLGLPIALADDEMYIREYIAQLDQDFLLVLVLEYFDESLVLLKRYMCWQLTDILYKVKNSRDYNFKEEKLPPDMREMHRNWSKADYLIYEHFNRTLWNNIAREGKDFYDELTRFRQVNQMASRFCDVTVVDNDTAVKRFGATPWNGEFFIDRQFCKTLNGERLLLALKRAHFIDLRNNGVNLPWPSWLGAPPQAPVKQKPVAKKPPQSDASQTVEAKEQKAPSKPDKSPAKGPAKSEPKRSTKRRKSPSKPSKKALR